MLPETVWLSRWESESEGAGCSLIGVRQGQVLEVDSPQVVITPWCAPAAWGQWLAARPSSFEAELLACIRGRQSCVGRCEEFEVKTKAVLRTGCVPAAWQWSRRTGHYTETCSSPLCPWDQGRVRCSRAGGCEGEVGSCASQFLFRRSNMRTSSKFI